MPKKPKFIKNHVRIFNDAVTIIDPNVDASDRQIMVRNNFKTASKNLVTFIKNGQQGTMARGVYRPSKLGSLTKDNIGVTATMGGYEHKPNFPSKGEDFTMYGGSSTNEAATALL